jgi:hypothetical protein
MFYPQESTVIIRFMNVFIGIKQFCTYAQSILPLPSQV